MATPLIVFRSYSYFSYVLSNIVLMLLLLLLLLQVITLKMEGSTTIAPACLAKLQVELFRFVIKSFRF